MNSFWDQLLVTLSGQILATCALASPLGILTLHPHFAFPLAAPIVSDTLSCWLCLSSPYSQPCNEAQLLLGIPRSLQAHLSSLYNKAGTAGAHTLQVVLYYHLTPISYQPFSQCRCCWRPQLTWTAHLIAPFPSWAKATTLASKELRTSWCMQASCGAFSTSKRQHQQTYHSDDDFEHTSTPPIF